MRKNRIVPEEMPQPHSLIGSKSDMTGYAMFPVADPRELGFRVVDECAEEGAIWADSHRDLHGFE